MIEKYRLLYEANPDFKEFVNRCMRKGKRYSDRKLEDVLAIKAVQNIGDYYSKTGENFDDKFGFPVSTVSTNDICECDDKSC